MLGTSWGPHSLPESFEGAETGNSGPGTVDFTGTLCLFTPRPWWLRGWQPGGSMLLSTRLIYQCWHWTTSFCSQCEEGAGQQNPGDLQEGVREGCENPLGGGLHPKCGGLSVEKSALGLLTYMLRKTKNTNCPKYNCFFFVGVVWVRRKHTSYLCVSEYDKIRG
jgi:hypothetical protein